MRNSSNLEAYAIYERYAPVMAVAEAARREAYEDLRNDEHGIVGEQLAEIGSERALGGSLTPTSDAQRIWVFDRVCRAVDSFSRRAPMHAEAAQEYIMGLPL